MYFLREKKPKYHTNKKTDNIVKVTVGGATKNNQFNWLIF